MDKFSYMSRPNLEYIEQVYEKFRQSPDQVDEKWKLFFEGLEFAQTIEGSSESLSTKEIFVYKLIQHYRDYGHIKAQLDPLGLSNKSGELFDLNHFNLQKQDLDSHFQVSQLVNLKQSKLKDIISHLEDTYCGTLTAEVSGCEPEVRQWFTRELESQSPSFQLSPQDKVQILNSLSRTESLERFIHTRFVGAKRFSVEGGDALLPMLERTVQTGTQNQVEEIVIGMAHRGRINVLANFMGKGLKVVLAEFAGVAKYDEGYDGDVKYHMGYSSDKSTPNGDCHISLAFNPSHLEAVNPVVCGMTRAKQRLRKDTEERKKVMPLLIHGDAAFIGQGVVSETLQLSKLEGYTVGGTIHVIINNQVGFTTNPHCSRSTRYSSDIAKSIKAPVLLVNGDDVEACVRAMDIAVRFRQEFNQDVVIDLICYRRYGHNEGDEPAFTQPKMYEKIKKHPTLRKIYAEQLNKENVQSLKDSDSFYQEKMDNLQKNLDEVRENPPESKPTAFEGLWKGFHRGTAEDMEESLDTSYDEDKLRELASLFTAEPEGFKIHSKIGRLIKARKKMHDNDKLDWAMGELLAYASLRDAGTSIRISGQDSERGTFTHRQAVYYNPDNGESFSPLKSFNKENGEFCIYNSSLSEMAVLGFEYGNAISDPTFLTIWEAQFGDFANGAQIIIDQFLSSGEQKWARMSGLTLLLPHGYAGQGPEHSSARLERFLQLCAQNNMTVCNLTTPANFFHVLRRQSLRDFRKPLIIMSPKSLLRHPKVTSSYRDLSQGRFQEVIDDPRLVDHKKVTHVVFCSGKVYYDLDKAREEKSLDHIALVRLEQIYPFPNSHVAQHLNGYPKLKKVIWLQEEPKNMGAYEKVRPCFHDLMENLGLQFKFGVISRPDKASPATGSPKIHEAEQNAIIESFLSL